ncbi:RidA family protein [Marinicauda algicola]|uniref:RidA family protein n=1 Tax=Marinicauda algicola TaxID=2029849 RepID=A0A4S2GZR2_9PROT|nr:RidA family protein [Marinicauda algicola]TGY88604.1 RidA family protein [Marinicauda algicola]
MSLTRHLATAAFGALALAACGAPDVTPGGSVPEDAGYAAPPEVRRDGLGAFRPAARAGGLVFLSAVTAPPGEDGTIPGDVESQTGAALRVLEEVLIDEGLGYSDLVSVRVLVVAGEDGLDTEGFTRAWQRTFGTRLQPHAPARSVAGISALPREGALVAIEAVAAHPAPETEETEGR